MIASDSPELGAPKVAALLAETPFAAALQADSPLLLAAIDPPRLVFANDSARMLFRAESLAELGEAAVTGPSPGAKRLRELGRLLTAGAPPRLELLRFFAGRTPLMVGLSCARLNDAGGAPLIVAASLAPALSRAQPPPNASIEIGPAASVGFGAPIAAGGSSATVGRFLWSVDEALRFGAPAAALVEILGANAPQTGEAFAALKIRIGLDRDGRLEAALAAKATFNELSVAWPLAAGVGATILKLSGAPILDSARRFLGFRGFGRLTGAANPTPAKDPSSRQALIAASPADRLPEASPTSDPAGQGAEIVQLRPAPLGVVGAQNVVPIRPDLRPFAPAEELRRSDGEAAIELTQSERNAFREIARALGAKVRPDESETSAADGEAASATSPGDLGAIAQTDAAQLTDRLPIGVLIARGADTLYLNRTLLDLLGYIDLDHFRSQSNLSRLFGETGAENFGPAGRSVALAAADGRTIAVEGLLQAIDWRGAPATMFSFRPWPVAETAPQFGAIEKEARERENETRELSAILDVAADGVLVLDRQGRIVSLNRSGEALFGVDHRQVLGRDFATLFAPGSREATKASFEALRASGLETLIDKSGEVSGLARDGREVPLFMTMARIGATAEAKFCAVMRDMTRWKEIERDLDDARRQAEKASALKSEFLAKISHEIRTPLNAIIGFAEVITEERFGPVGNDRYKDYVKDIHASGGHVMSLVNDLLDLSKIEAGKADLQFAPIDANLVIQECLALMQPQAANERVIMRLSLAEKLPRVVADERSLRQIMLNLMSNAVKFNEPGGQVIVSTALNDSGKAVIRVRDTGVGMSEGEIATALEPFRQVGETRRTDGTGLGLPLTKALAEANRAQFSIKSGKEQGTLVELAFPTTPAAAAQ
jgi:PAS domain S-box-containing protein